LFLPDSENGEPEFASLSEIYVSQELSNREKGMPKDQEEAFTTSPQDWKVHEDWTR